ncbi:hypothetical protein COCNU_scaffold004407G000010 [Cocos nucifera]|nr:hypothetical protein [Cocos nucifera]
MAPLDAIATSEVAKSTEVPHPIGVPSIVEIDATGGSVPPASTSSPTEDHSIEREGEEEKKKKRKMAIVKLQCKARPSRSIDNDDLEEGPFSTPDTIRDMVDKFALSMSGHQLLASIKKVNHLKSKSSRVQEKLQAEVNRLQERTVEADHLLEVKMAKILEAKVQAVEELKISSEMMDPNIVFSQEAFQKGYELYEDRVARKFSELDLGFLYGDVSNEEARPSIVVTDPYPAEAALEPSKLAIKASKPMLELKVVPEALSSPAAPSEFVEPAPESATTTGASSFSPVSPPEVGDF